MNLSALDPDILLPALAAGLLVLATHAPLGRRVLERGIIFIDLAIAQIAGLGVLLTGMLFDHTEPWATQSAAFGAALLGALALYLCERRWPQVLEAIIGSAFVLAATAAILVLAGDPRSGEHLQALLVGQILWVTPQQLLPAAVLSAAVLLAWFGTPLRRTSLGFYLLFALAVTASVQLVGVYLVFASLILPALGSRALPGRQGIALAYGVGVAGYVSGLGLSAVFDLPAGPVVVWTLAICALIGGWLWRSRSGRP